MSCSTPDPEAINLSSAEALGYAARVEALGRATAFAPTLELVYGPDRGQRLDVYAPTRAHSLPIVVFFHGGSWINGHRGWLRFMAPCVLQLPAVFVAGTYRLAPRCRWPAQYEDVRDALWCVERNAERIGGDPGRVVVSGHSAGGHLATLAVLKRQTPPLLACFPVSCSQDLQYGNVSLESQEGRVYKYLFKDRTQDFDASPINFVGGNTTPFHVAWGERDFVRILDSTRRFVHAMQGQPGAITTAVLPGASHFDCHLALADARHSWYARLKDTLYGVKDF